MGLRQCVKCGPALTQAVVGFVVVASVVGWSPSGALANGAETIGAAPQLPIGQAVSSGWSEQKGVDGGGYGEWWRVQMTAGDKLTIDAEVVSTGCENEKPITELRMYAPSVTDYTLNGETQTAAKTELDEPNPHGELVFVAPSTGDWSLLVTDGGACSTLSYNFTARLQHKTTATLNGPRLVRTAHPLTLSGTIAGVGEGTISIQLQRHGWRTIGTASIATNGSFRWTGKAPKRGSWHYRVVYAGDANHLSSRAAHTLMVR
jgi:hypothetical protein